LKERKQLDAFERNLTPWEKPVDSSIPKTCRLHARCRLRVIRSLCLAFFRDFGDLCVSIGCVPHDQQ
jgi:hypothetical protein